MKKFEFKTPHDAVFVENYGKGGGSLFESQIDLAGAIMEYPGSEFKSKNALTVRSAVSQIFTGERNLSKTLRTALFLALESKFDKKKFDFKMFEEALVEKFKIHYEDRYANKRSRYDADFWNLIDATKSAREILITTLEPAELHKSTLADRLKDELLQKTGIVKRNDELLKPASYIFYLPDTKGGRIAREFWEKLRSYAIEEYGLNFSEINISLEKANSGETPTIRTYLIEERIALYPFVFLDYSSPKIRGFCVSYVSEIPSVAELSYDVVYTWKSEIYPDLKNKPEYKFENLIK